MWDFILFTRKKLKDFNLTSIAGIVSLRAIMFLKLKSLLLFITVWSLFFFPTLNFAKTQAERAIKDKILLLSGSEPSTLDPQLASGLPEQVAALALFEGLLNLDPKDCSPVPGLASFWEILPDGKTYIFYLRPEAVWSDGSSIKAQDFIFSAKRILSPALGSALVTFFYPVKGAKGYYEGTVKDFSEVGLSIIDDYTLQIELEEPTPYFLNFLAHASWYPVPESVIQKYGAYDQPHTPWASQGISNGPFVLKKWDLGQKMVFEKNPLYWNQANVKLNGIHMLCMGGGSTQERAFRAGQLHVTDVLPLNKYAALKEKNAPELFVAPAWGTYCYAFNTAKAPFNDRKVRQALSLAIDRKMLIERVVMGDKMPAYTFTPPEGTSYIPPEGLKEDITKAKELLAQAGYPNGQGFPKVKILFNSSEAHSQIAEALQAMWYKNLNIIIDIDSEEWKVFLNTRKAKNFDIVRGNWMGDYLDPLAFLEVYTSFNGNNYTSFASQAYDNLIAESNTTPDPQERYKILQKAESLLLEEIPVLPLYYFNTVHLLDPRVKGWYPNILNLHPFNAVYFEDIES